MRGFVVSICLLCMPAAGPASAQSYYQQGYAPPSYAQQGYARQPMPQTPPLVVAAPSQETRGNYGGGFIEFVFGERPLRNGAPPPQQNYIAPPQGYGGSQTVQQYANANPQMDPMLEQPGPPIDPVFEPQDVDYRGPEVPGTIVVDTPKHFLYLVQENGRATRYGIGVGRPGFTWSGAHTVTAKKEWPDWVPPQEMLQRQPYLPHFMPGGPNNPLGARAMYLGSTLYRIHGTNEPDTIGTNVSSGCIRLTNEDVSDLYSRVKVGTRVVVM
jgi:lipoprotein-anchoring transpeptidase ErfK/SrfK